MDDKTFRAEVERIHNASLPNAIVREYLGALIEQGAVLLPAAKTYAKEENISAEGEDAPKPKKGKPKRDPNLTTSDQV